MQRQHSLAACRGSIPEESQRHFSAQPACRYELEIVKKNFKLKCVTSNVLVEMSMHEMSQLLSTLPIRDGKSVDRIKWNHFDGQNHS